MKEYKESEKCRGWALAPSRNDRVGTGWACGGRHGLAMSCLNAVIASHIVAWQSRRDGTGAVENVQEAAHASAGLPRRDLVPPRNDRVETEWACGGRYDLAMSCLNAVIASHRVAWQSSMRWYRRCGERSRGCPCVGWIAASGPCPSSQ